MLFKIDIWNRSFRKVENTEEFAALTENLLTRTSATMSVAMRNDINAFRNFVTSVWFFLFETYYFILAYILYSMWIKLRGPQIAILKDFYYFYFN